MSDFSPIYQTENYMQKVSSKGDLSNDLFCELPKKCYSLLVRSKDSTLFPAKCIRSLWYANWFDIFI